MNQIDNRQVADSSGGPPICDNIEYIFYSIWAYIHTYILYSRLSVDMNIESTGKIYQLVCILQYVYR